MSEFATLLPSVGRNRYQFTLGSVRNFLRFLQSGVELAIYPSRCELQTLRKIAKLGLAQGVEAC
jgi:hypothetical protein